jgi:hypothetical protein
MYQLNEAQIEMVSGGEMSTETKVIIGVSLAVCPVLGVGMLLGYYANTK